MNRYETIEQHMQGLSLNSFEREHLEAAKACVLRLMANGTPTIELVADGMSMHSSKFRRRVKAVTGIAPADYITLVRMRHALQMMADHPRFNISQVAQRCGYADAAHFSHAFRRWFGCSPLQYVEGKMAGKAP